MVANVALLLSMPVRKKIPSNGLRYPVYYNDYISFKQGILCLHRFLFHALEDILLRLWFHAQVILATLLTLLKSSYHWQICLDMHVFVQNRLIVRHRARVPATL